MAPCPTYRKARRLMHGGLDKLLLPAGPEETNQRLSFLWL